ncbi:hypothetical protein VaNZ11_013419 [Volvox africanus]|uniref:Translation factor GUF1 homolog, mitochondrial n=1 Tax=Volvox africanus TaxID=51714 RepID=A0ABQ5SHD8_9CHLO|nr:hypothetical protein VaNZ11_013419 [Volvox africanus]
MALLNAACPAAVLRAAAAYAAFEAASQGWLATRNAWTTASAVQACVTTAWPSDTASTSTSTSTTANNGICVITPSCPLTRSPTHLKGRSRTSTTRDPCEPVLQLGQAASATIPFHLASTPPTPPPFPGTADDLTLSRAGATAHQVWDTGDAGSPFPAAWSVPPAASTRLQRAALARDDAVKAAYQGLPFRTSLGPLKHDSDEGHGAAEPRVMPSPRGPQVLQGAAEGRFGGGNARGVTSAAAAVGEGGRWQGRLGRDAVSRVAATILRGYTSASAVAGEGESAEGGGVAPAQPHASPSQRQEQSEAKGTSSPEFPQAGFVAGGYDVASFPPDRIRNFSIIAHVDHGKSTLADRLMEMTGALGSRTTHHAQYLDKLQVERERGITVKAQTVSLVHQHKGVPYLLNLIDTPGHVDFSYEVSRSLAACQGALLVVDGGQGIQAQTVANFYLAFEQGMDLIPVVNKIDLPAADPRGCAEQIAAAFDMDPEAVLFTSAKTGQGMEAVLPAVIERIRSPQGDPSGPLRMLLFDAFHDEYRGVVLLVEVVDGRVEVGMRVAMASTGAAYEVQEVGLQAPERHPTGRLLTGQVGYLLCGIKDLKAARVGDTLYAAAHQSQGVAAGAAIAGPPPPRLPGFKPAKAMVFAGLFPLGGDGQEFESLATAMDKLLLNDASVVVKRENSEALGPGFRCGFLGMLHMEIFTQRLQQEYGASVVTTTPMVPYVLEMPDGISRTLESASEYPTDTRVSLILEPTVTATLISPDAYLGRLMELCAARRGEQLEHSSLGGGRTMLRYRLPLAELAGDFYSLVKSRSQGYASFDYEEGPYRPADLVRLDILAHGKPVDALARMVAREEAASIGRALLVKMKDLLDRQQFEVVLQAAANGKIVARETIKALRKNVTAKCYGGDVTRKRKLLDRQKEGKRRMKRLGSIDVPQELFPELMKTR